MKHMKRPLAWLLALCMILSVVPFGVFAEETNAETTPVDTASGESAATENQSDTDSVDSGEIDTYSTGDVLDAAIFCSDVHGYTGDLTSVLDGVKTSGVDYSSIGFVGDTCLTVADTTSTVQSALGDAGIKVMFSYAASHDTENSADINTNWDYSGEVEGVSDYYLVYTIRETDMQNASSASSAAPAFTTWYNGLTDDEKALPIFIMSHRPLHERRDDNAGAAAWYEVISDAAESSDIVFFWAHNHTGETGVDQAAYYVAKDGTETITVEGGPTVAPNFTYMNAGYINANNQNPKRINVATTVQITSDALIFRDYTTSGAYTDSSYSHNVEVAREFAPEEETPVETTAPAEAEKTISYVNVNEGDGAAYAVGESLLFQLLVTYDDDTTETVNRDVCEVVSVTDLSTNETVTLDTAMNTVGEYSAVVAYQGVEAATALTFTVGDEEDFEGGATSYDTLSLLFGGATLTADVKNVTADVADAMASVEGISNYVAYDISATVDGEPATVSIPVPAEWATDSLTVYYITEDGVVSDETFEGSYADGYYTFTTSHFSTYVLTDGTKVETGSGDSDEVPGSSTTVNVWKLTSSLTNNGTYLIVNRNTAGSGYALLNNNGSISAVAVKVVNDGTNTYIELDNANAVWTFAASDSDWLISNNGNYLVHPNNSLGLSTTGVTWASEGTNLYYKTTVLWWEELYYLTGGSSWSVSEGEANVYFYTPGTITTGTEGGKYSVEGADQQVDAVSGETVTLTSKLYFTTTTSGTTTEVTNHGLTPTYEVVRDTNGILNLSGSTATLTGKAGYAVIKVIYTNEDLTAWDEFVIEAVAPTFGVAITALESIQVKVGDTTTLTAVADMNDTAIEGATIIWSSSDESIATVDASGAVTGAAAGEVTITASYTDPNGTVHTDTVNLEVVDAVYALEISKKTENEDGTYTTEPITAPIVIKDVDTLIDNGTNTHSVWAVIYKDGEDMGTLSEENLAKLTFTSSDESIATVDKATGVVTFVGGEGTVQITAIYEYADGKSVTDTVTFSVSKSSYVLPEDGTNDFPEYPNQGAIRIDKTAVAVGNFSETGIAMVELSMTGVPYTTGNEIDVVMMLDMTGSMDDVTSSTSTPTGYVRVDAAIAASKAFIKTIVKNEDGSYNGNRVGVYVFNKNGAATLYTFGTVGSDTELDAIYDDLNSIYDDHHASGGTPYDDGLAKCYEVLAAAKTDGTGDDRQQFAVFMTDGVPTSYAYVNGTTYGTHNSASSIAGMLTSSDNYATRDTDYKYEYYSTEMKKAGVTVYSVGVGLENTNNAWSGTATQCLNLASVLLNDISGPGGETTQPDAVGTSTLSKKDSYFFSVDDADAATEMENVFTNIAVSILQAATDVTVEDKIDSHYTMNFSLPSGVTSAEADDMSEFYIQVVGYTLDATTHERTGNPTVVENFTFNANGTLKSHTVDGAACGGSCGHVTITNGTVTAINGTYFTYTSDTNGEVLTWKAEKLDTTELALQYFVYLDNSAGDVAAADQVEAGTYNTNEYATITYTNYLGNVCRKEFPVPSLTWMGAQVTYVFYLVNKDGQPVNRAGRVVPFAEAVYVTDPVTYDVTWNEETGSEKLSAAYLAKNYVPDVFALYDSDAYYEILVYQTEGVDSETDAVNYNHFIIEGSSSVANMETTKVFNTKAGTKYDDYGAYSATAGDYTSTKSGTSYTATVTNDIDYANTTVAFAVVWKPELAEDTVVVDFGLDVVIDVTTNDAMASGVVGVRADAPGVTINTGNYTAVKATSVDLYIDANNDDDNLKKLKIGTATRESLTSVRFSLDKTNGMQFTDPVIFYYESDVNYYDTDGKLVTTSMYSSVTVIPATTVYYEDEYVTLKTYTSTDATGADGNTIYNVTDGWTKNSTAATATQDQDRPGASRISETLDADNNYGYDSAYANMSQYSMGSAAMVTVNTGTYATAEFEFYGTGFDIISLTDATTGTIVIDIYNGDTLVLTETVDTYYGYKRVVNDDGTYSWETTTSNDPNALYQVPVMKIGDGVTTKVLPYGKYKAVITATYIPFLDHTTGDGYNFYLDAIRIYNPTGNLDATANNAYAADGEGYPEYFEVRDQIISANTFNSLTGDNSISGMVFIDGTTAGAGTTASVADYISYGPNNEVYLDLGNAVAFDLNATASGGEVAKIQLAIKTVGGTGNVEVYGVKDGVTTTCLSETISTATDMYYDITALNGMTVVIKNAGTGSDAIVSITNVKVTYTQAQPAASDAAAASLEEETTAEAAAPALFSIRRSTADAAVATLSVEEEIPETTVPEETEPEETVPETTVPEETEPEETVPETTVPEETEPEETEPEADTTVETVAETIGKIIKKLFGWLFG